MIELKIIINICKEVFGIDIRKKNRKEINVAARFFYFYYAVKMTRYTVTKIGAEIGYKHSSVLHGQKRYESFKSQFPEFRIMFLQAENSIKKAFDEDLGFDVSGMNQYEIEIQVLKNRLHKQQNENCQLRSRLKKYTSKLHPELNKLITETDDLEMEDFIKYKVKPHLKSLLFYKAKQLTA
jgi:hypothetical protein